MEIEIEKNDSNTNWNISHTVQRSGWTVTTGSFLLEFCTLIAR